MTEVNQVVEAIDTKFEEFKTRHGKLDEKTSELNERLFDLEQRQAAPGTMANKAQSEAENERAALVEYVRTGDKSVYEKRALQIVAPGTGGVSVQPTMSNAIDDQLQYLSPFRQHAEVVQVASNQFDKIIGTGGSAAARRLETADRTETASPAMAKVSITLAELSCVPHITNELISSSNFDVEQWVKQQVTEAVSLAENNEVINGTGANGQMQGVLTATQSADDDDSRTFGQLQAITSGTNGVFDADDLLTLVYKLAPAYRPSGKFYMATSAIEAARKLKDSNGAYIWRDPISEAMGPMLGGYPVVEVPELPAVATDAVPVIFGDLRKGYTIAENLGHRMFLVDQVTKKGWTLLFYTTFTGGGVTDSNAIKLLKLSA